MTLNFTQTSPNTWEHRFSPNHYFEISKNNEALKEFRNARN